jgi:hypothetical protein
MPLPMRIAYTLMCYMASVFTESNSSGRRTVAQSFAAPSVAGSVFAQQVPARDFRPPRLTKVTARCRLGDKRGNFGVGLTRTVKRAEASDSGRSQIGRHPPMQLPAQSDETRRA